METRNRNNPNEEQQNQSPSRRHEPSGYVFDKRDELSGYEGYCSLTYFFIVLREIALKAIPRIVSFEFNLMTMSLINIYILGQRGNIREIIIFGLGDVWARIVSYSIIKYKNMTLQQESTIAVVAQRPHLVGTYYQRSLLIVGLICMACAGFLCFGWKILVLAGIDQTIAMGAGDYMWVCLSSVFCYGYFDTTNNYLQSQNVLYPQIGIGLLQIISHYFLATWLIDYRDMGVLGAAWAKNFSDCISAALIYFFIAFKRPTPRTWFEWDHRAFIGIIDYLKNSIRNGIGQYIEEVAFLMMTMMAMYLEKHEDTATHIALQNSGLFHFSFFLGIQFCITSYIASAVTRGSIKRAKRRAFMCVLIGFCFIGFGLFFLLNNKSQWSMWFSTNVQIQENLQASVFLYAKILAADGLQLTFGAIVKALDLFKPLAIVYFFSYYVVGFSVSIYYGFYMGLGEIGIWTGWLYSAGVSTVCFIIIICCTNWHKQHLKIKDRLVNILLVNQLVTGLIQIKK